MNNPNKTQKINTLAPPLYGDGKKGYGLKTSLIKSTINRYAIISDIIRHMDGA